MFNVHVPTADERAAMWENEISFCPDRPGSGLTASVVSDSISTNVFSSNADFSELLRQRYVKMTEKFKTVSHTSAEWEQDFGGETCTTVACNCKPDARLAVPTRHIASGDYRISRLFDEPSFGLDLPVWFHRTGRDETMPRVMFVSQDPLRTDPREGYLYISSPWAFHSRDFRRTEKKSIPTMLVDCLVAQGACLYLTDAAKLFARDHDYSDRHILPDLRQEFQTVLRDEIRRFDPAVIVAVGEPASRAVLELGGKPVIENWTDTVIPRANSAIADIAIEGRTIPCVSVAHFGRITRHRQDLTAEYEFNEENGNENYIPYYVDAINSALDANTRRMA